MVQVHWTAYVTALTIPILAGIGAFIAYRQWRTAQNKLKLDLFEKRVLVYEAVRDTLGHIAAHGSISQDQQIKYLSGIQTAKWLFDKKVHDYLNETLWHKIVDLELHHKLSSAENRGDPERSKHIHLQAETLKWLVAQYSVLDSKCEKFMAIGH